jgi:hypothetical protein
MPCLELVLDDRGASGDRRWMLVDEFGRFISQREMPLLCMFDIAKSDTGYRVTAREMLNGTMGVDITLLQESGAETDVTVWSDTVRAIEAPEHVNQFFSEALATRCRLVYMPEQSHRKADANYAGQDVLTSFSDGYPLLLIGSASLDDLNARLKNVRELEIGWDRFRPNIVACTQEAWVEDSWVDFSLGEVRARGVKLCSRCVMTTINQSDGTKSKEPLKTLATYRNFGGKVMVGQNVVAGKGIIRVGDEILVNTFGFPPNAKS